ncbi:hypothetical protein Bca4012_083287 [Brassica carinata]
MVRCVRFWRGEWKKNGEEEWEFVTHPEDFGYTVLINETASYETPLVISYRLPTCMLLPQGNKTPPTTIASTAVLSWLLHGRPWLGELSLLVTMGPRAVAEYEFLCRTNFCIGNTTYTFDYTANENSRAAYESRFHKPKQNLKT